MDCIELSFIQQNWRPSTKQYATPRRSGSKLSGGRRCRVNERIGNVEHKGAGAQGCPYLAERECEERVPAAAMRGPRSGASA
eukprot:6536460-Prymnesium_polylepis.2